MYPCWITHWFRIFFWHDASSKRIITEACIAPQNKPFHYLSGRTTDAAHAQKTILWINIKVYISMNLVVLWGIFSPFLQVIHVWTKTKKLIVAGFQIHIKFNFKMYKMGSIYNAMPLSYYGWLRSLTIVRYDSKIAHASNTSLIEFTLVWLWLKTKAGADPENIQRGLQSIELFTSVYHNSCALSTSLQMNVP
jgi:hypothetical protein